MIGMNKFELKRRSKDSYVSYVQGFKAAVKFMEKQLKKELSVEDAVTQMKIAVHVMEATVKLLENIPLEVKVKEEG